jgi:hypothetical protein
MAEAARWLEWQGRGAVARTAAVALGAGATAGAFIHAAFMPGPNRWLRVPVVTTVRHASRERRSEVTSGAQPEEPVTAVARRLIALTGLLRPEPCPLEELHAPENGYFDSEALVEAALAVPGLQLRVLRVRDGYSLDAYLAAVALATWSSTLIEFEADVHSAGGEASLGIERGLVRCRKLRVLRCDLLGLATYVPPLPSLRELTIVGSDDGPSELDTSDLDTFAVSFPRLEHLHVGCDDADGAPLLFARIPTLTCVTFCAGPNFTLLPPQSPLMIPPAPQARRVPHPVAGINDVYATLYPNVEHLQMIFFSASPSICALTKLRVLGFSVNGYVERTLRKATYICKSDPIDVPTDAETAQLLASLPVLEVLDLSVYNGRNMRLTFASTDYQGVVAPRLRVLKAAGAGQLRGEGLRALARICPNLRHLDVRAAFAMSRHEFEDGLVDCGSAIPPATAVGADDAAQAVGAGAGAGGARAPRQTQRLRLPKLRRLYSSFRRRLPKVLNFNVYRSGWTDVQPDETGALGEPRDVETEPLLEPEYVLVRFKPRSNNRRLILHENRGLPVDVLRIEEPVPGEFPP